MVKKERIQKSRWINVEENLKLIYTPKKSLTVFTVHMNPIPLYNFLIYTAYNQKYK